MYINYHLCHPHETKKHDALKNRIDKISYQAIKQKLLNDFLIFQWIIKVYQNVSKEKNRENVIDN